MKLQKNEETLNQIAVLVKEAFNKKGDLTKDPNFYSRYKHSDGYGIINENKLASYVMVNTFDSRVFTKKLPMAAIGYVSSSKECRGQGNISKLILEILKDLHDQGIPYTNLAPFSESFYQQYGFENTIYLKSYDFTQKALKTVKKTSDGEVKYGKWEDLIIQNGAAQLYEIPMHSTNERNTMNRPYWWWQRFQTYYPNRKLAVYFGRVGLPEAYMFYTVNGSNVKVDDLYSTTGDGFRGLLGFLESLGDSSTKYTILTAPNNNLADFFSNQSLLDIKIRPYMMSRIIDFETILSSMKLVNQGTFVVEVKEDKLCPWNKGSWEITKTDKELKISKTDKPGEIKGTIKSWTKVLLGELTVKEAIQFGEIKGDKYTKLAFSKGTISFYDYY